MNKQEFNRLAAEFLGYKVKFTWSGNAYMDEVNNRLIYRFNPYDDANDLGLLEDKLKIYTSPDNNRWRSEMNPSSEIGYKLGYGKTPHESRRACAEEYLKEWK